VVAGIDVKIGTRSKATADQTSKFILAEFGEGGN
jgi:hypothetical protein